MDLDSNTTNAALSCQAMLPPLDDSNFMESSGLGSLVNPALSWPPGSLSTCFQCFRLQLNSSSWKSLCLLPAPQYDWFLLGKWPEWVMPTVCWGLMGALWPVVRVVVYQARGWLLEFTARASLGLLNFSWPVSHFATIIKRRGPHVWQWLPFGLAIKPHNNVRIVIGNMMSTAMGSERQKGPIKNDPGPPRDLSVTWGTMKREEFCPDHKTELN